LKEISMANLRVTKNRDNTWTIRVGRQVEYVSVEGKTKAQLFDAVKYAAISKGAVISDIKLTEILNG
jgi:hypothetical protein